MKNLKSKLSKITTILVLLGILFLVLLGGIFNGYLSGLYGLWDMSIFLIMLVSTILILMLAELLLDYICGIKFLFGNKEYTNKELKLSYRAMKFTSKATNIVAIIGILILTIYTLSIMDDPLAWIGPYVSRTIIFTLYTLIVNLLYLAIMYRIEKELMYRGCFTESYKKLVDNLPRYVDKTDEEDLQSKKMVDNLNLTRRENEIYELLVKGNSNREIREVLHIEEATVKKHVQNILKKAECGNRVELIEKYGK